MGLIPGLGMYTLNKLLVYAQPAHLSVALGVGTGDSELAFARATYVRRALEDEVGRRGA
jgi:protein arginine kinase